MRAHVKAVSLYRILYLSVTRVGDLSLMAIHDVRLGFGRVRLDAVMMRRSGVTLGTVLPLRGGGTKTSHTSGFVLPKSLAFPAESENRIALAESTRSS